MDLVKLENKLPIKAYPQETLANVLVQVLAPWLAKRLSIKGEKMDELEAGLEAVKDLCRTMGMHQVKEMFELYAQGRMSIKPRSNYFDYILVGQIVNEYRKDFYKPETPKPQVKEELTEEEKELLMYQGCITCFDAYVQDKRIPEGSTGVYMHLYDLKLLPHHNKEFRAKIMERALDRLKKGQKPKDLLQRLRMKNDDPNAQQKLTAKYIILEDYFNELIKEGKHIKDLI